MFNLIKNIFLTAMLMIGLYHPPVLTFPKLQPITKQTLSTVPLSFPKKLLGGTNPPNQLTAENDLQSTIDPTESSYFAKYGKYQQITSAPFISQYPSTYQVDEWVKGDNEAKGYTITIEHYENESVLNATTSKMEIVPVLKRTIINR